MRWYARKFFSSLFATIYKHGERLIAKGILIVTLYIWTDLRNAAEEMFVRADKSLVYATSHSGVAS
jgi:hypothetical protein